MNNKKQNKTPNKITIESLERISPHNQALYETGKEILKNSINTGRDFSKFMITISTSEIPIYLALINFVLSISITYNIIILILSIIPPFGFLISTIIFIFAYFPRVDFFSLDIIDEIKEAYEKIIKKRQKYLNLGIISFLTSNILTIIALMIHIIF